MGQEITEYFSVIYASVGPSGKPPSLFKKLGSVDQLIRKIAGAKFYSVCNLRYF